MEKTEVKKGLAYYLTFAGHLVFIAGWLTASFWLPWPLIILLSLILYLQSKLLGYCVVTKWQFGTSDKSFWVHYLGKIGIKVVRQQVTDYTIRFLVISPILGWLWQTWMW